MSDLSSAVVGFDKEYSAVSFWFTEMELAGGFSLNKKESEDDDDDEISRF